MEVTEQIDNVHQLGSFIRHLCSGKQTYKLKRKSVLRSESYSSLHCWHPEYLIISVQLHSHESECWCDLYPQIIHLLEGANANTIVFIFSSIYLQYSSAADTGIKSWQIVHWFNLHHGTSHCSQSSMYRTSITECLSMQRNEPDWRLAEHNGFVENIHWMMLVQHRRSSSPSASYPMPQFINPSITFDPSAGTKKSAWFPVD